MAAKKKAAQKHPPKKPAPKKQLLEEGGGSPTCEHKNYDKQYLLGADTGDKTCRDCGADF